MPYHDFDIDDRRADENLPGNCTRGLRKHLLVLAGIAVVTLAVTSWFISQDALAQQPTSAVGALTTREPAPGSVPLTIHPAAILAASPGNARHFSAIVAGLHGTVVSIGRSRMRNRFDVNGATEPAQAVTPGTEGTLQFAVPTVGAVLDARRQLRWPVQRQL